MTVFNSICRVALGGIVAAEALSWVELERPLDVFEEVRHDERIFGEE